MAKLRGQPRHQVVDPTISRSKFEREVAAFRRHEKEYRRRGWVIISARYPQVVLLLAAPQLKPVPVLFGVVLDYTNYDVDPPSVSIINPWTGEPLRAEELLTPLPRVRLLENAVSVGNQAPHIDVGQLLQWWEPTDLPFLCIRGVREYHRHPGHSGDSWLLHRGRGEGRLLAILDAIHSAGVASIQSYRFKVVLQYEQGGEPPLQPVATGVAMTGFIYGIQ
jgi:hypothetical protein